MTDQCAYNQKHNKFQQARIIDWNDKELSPSVYIQLLRMCRPELKVNKAKYDFGVEVVDPPARVKFDALTRRELTILPCEVQKDFNVCPRKFFFSYVAQDYPSFSNDFHIQFVYGGLLRSLALVTGDTIAKVKKRLDPLFPQWNTLIKKQIREQVKCKSTDSECQTYDNVNYTKDRLWVHFLHPNLVNYSEEIYLPSGKRELDEEVTSTLLFEANQQLSYCMYCPHNEYCPDTVYFKDTEEVEQNGI